MTSSPPSGRRVGYARVSKDDQNLSLQFDALAQQGVSNDLIFTDKLSGAKDDRPGLGRCLKTLQAGDTLVDDICKTLHISRTTYYRYVREGRRIAACRLPPVASSPDAADTASFADPPPVDPPPVVDTRPPAG